MKTFSSWSAALGDAFNRVREGIGLYLPSVLGAFLLLLVGWITARLLRALAVRLTRFVDQLIYRLYQRRGVERPRVPPASAEILGNIIFWLVMLFFLTAATQVLGLTVFLGWLERLVTYLPSLLAGGLIVLAGFLLSRLVRDLILATATAATQGQRVLLGQTAQVVILATAVVIGADQIGIRITFLVIMATVVVSTMLGGAALAVSLGARTYVANLIGAHYLRQTYRAGQTIRIAGFEGRILEVTPTAVSLETREGRATLPAKVFNEEPTVLLMGQDHHG